MILQEHIVKKLESTTRFEAYCLDLFPQLPSRKGVKRAIKSGELLLNGQLVEGGRWLKVEDKIQLIDLELNIPKAFHLKFPVVYEDEYLAIINKPAGFVTSGNQFKTIENALQVNIQLSNQEDALKWPKPVHRLDSPTSGLLIASKTKKAHIILGQMFEQKTIQKTYHAIVQGKLENHGTIESTIEEQNAHTVYQSLKIHPSLKDEFITLVELQPKTGRTHQLRIHLSNIGHPIVGDKIYGKEGNILKNKGLFLAAVALEFEHPITKEDIKIKVESPHKFHSLLEREQRRWKKYAE